ncbi:MAG: K+/H+ antiporter subunit F [Burkholderiaceae bacterium]
MSPILAWGTALAMLCFAVAMLFALIRLFRGPAAQDRVLALDTMYMNAMMILLVLGIRFDTMLYFEVALIIAMLGFVSSVALAKFLLRGEVIE